MMNRKAITSNPLAVFANLIFSCWPKSVLLALLVLSTVALAKDPFFEEDAAALRKDSEALEARGIRVTFDRETDGATYHVSEEGTRTIYLGKTAEEFPDVARSMLNHESKHVDIDDEILKDPTPRNLALKITFVAGEYKTLNSALPEDSQVPKGRYTIGFAVEELRAYAEAAHQDHGLALSMVRTGKDPSRVFVFGQYGNLQAEGGKELIRPTQFLLKSLKRSVLVKLADLANPEPEPIAVQHNYLRPDLSIVMLKLTSDLGKPFFANIFIPTSTLDSPDFYSQVLEQVAAAEAYEKFYSERLTKMKLFGAEGLVDGQKPSGPRRGWMRRLCERVLGSLSI